MACAADARTPINYANQTDAETYRKALEALRNIHVATMEAHAIRGARIRVLEDSLRNISSQIGALIHA